MKWSEIGEKKGLKTYEKGLQRSIWSLEHCYQVVAVDFDRFRVVTVEISTIPELC